MSFAVTGPNLLKMQHRKLFIISLAINVVCMSIGAIYLARKLEAFLDTHSSQNTEQVSNGNSPAGFVSTLDYQWPRQLFENEPVSPGAIVFLGDSLTDGGHWPEVWRGRTRTPVLSRGLSGDTMDVVLRRLDEVIRHQPSKCFVMIGINDLRFDRKSPAVLVSQYRALIYKIRLQSPRTKIYLLGLLPVWGAINGEIGQVNRQLARLAHGSNVYYVDLNSLMADAQGQLDHSLTFDGVHLRALGYQKWRDAIWPIVHELSSPGEGPTAPAPTGTQPARSLPPRVATRL